MSYWIAKSLHCYNESSTTLGSIDRKKIRLQHKRRDEKFVYWLTCEQKKHDSRLWLRPVQNDGKLGVLLRQDQISNPNKYFLISNFLIDGLNFPVCFRNEIHSAWDWFFLVLDYAVFELFARKKEVYTIWCTQKLSKHFAKQMRENCTHSDRIANTTKHIHVMWIIFTAWMQGMGYETAYVYLNFKKT